MRGVVTSLVLVLFATSCEPPAGVTVYTSVDEAYSRPILEAFEASTGISVRAVYDVEAQKTTGLFQRLLAEKQRPRADVFWNSEVSRTIQLAQSGVLAPFHSDEAVAVPAQFRDAGGLWTGCGLRARVIIYHRRLLGDGEPPRSIVELASPRFRGQAAIARPLFGTSVTHAGALCAALGAARAREFWKRLIDNDVRIVEGNAIVRRLVASGEVAVGLTDTDDAHEALLRVKSVGIVYPDQEGGFFPGREAPLGTFVIPATVALIAGSPRPELGKRLVDYLVGHAVEETLVRGSAAFIPIRDDMEPRASLQLPSELISMDVTYEDVAEGIEASRPFLHELFLR